MGKDNTKTNIKNKLGLLSTGHYYFLKYLRKFEGIRVWFAPESIKKVKLYITDDNGKQIEYKEIYVRNCIGKNNFREITTGVKISKKNNPFMVKGTATKASNNEVLNYISSIEDPRAMYDDLKHKKKTSKINKIKSKLINKKNKIKSIPSNINKNRVESDLRYGKIKKACLEENSYIFKEGKNQKTNLDDILAKYNMKRITPNMSKDEIQDILKLNGNKLEKEELNFSNDDLQDNIKEQNINDNDPMEKQINENMDSKKEEKEENILNENIVSKNEEKEETVSHNNFKEKVETKPSYSTAHWASKSIKTKEKMVIPSNGKSIESLAKQMEHIMKLNRIAISNIDGITISSEFFSTAKEIEEYYYCKMYGRKTNNTNVLNALQADKYGKGRQI